MKFLCNQSSFLFSKIMIALLYFCMVLYGFEHYICMHILYILIYIAYSVYYFNLLR